MFTVYRYILHAIFTDIRGRGCTYILHMKLVAWYLYFIYTHMYLAEVSGGLVYWRWTTAWFKGPQLGFRFPPNRRDLGKI